ncbi:hypothetical protein NC796_00115 [Aliifodinibius sp. S!AR15-10]|uniref:hypothetical protein n=1 Tax=Aliifodinibius sp. S!AR15-10 TaxID=2950437 RepID=UPI00285E8603|nr:hypothetical protein [Aliifodinibius sp. S!AR15-10]MDR8389517.1 hypothetical protein [Aliifodinibius sp. S!AR15-10]
MKKIVLIFACIGVGITSAFAQGVYEVKKVCNGHRSSAMVVEYQKQYYVITSNTGSFTRNILVADIPAINFDGSSQMRFLNSAGITSFDFVKVVKPGQFVRINNRWQRFLYSGLPGARSVCRQIAYGY